MRWTVAEEGSTRVRSWFALLPVTIGPETRWLERVAVEERQEFHVSDVCRVTWRQMRFVDCRP